jgi:hypothetical protein
VEWRRIGMERARSFAVIGTTPAAHATITLQDCHPSVSLLEAERAVKQIPQHEGGNPTEVSLSIRCHSVILNNKPFTAYASRGCQNPDMHETSHKGGMRTEL